MSEWDREWKDFNGPNFFGNMLYGSQKRAISKILRYIGLKNPKIIDVGCGTGRTLVWFREFGFKNSIGVDNSKEAIKFCVKRGFKVGKDVFKKSIVKNNLKTNSFDIVFADGVLEHFKNFEPLVKQMCRISKKYVLITQPNHFSLYGRLLEVFTKKDVHEYSYKIKDFERVFSKYNFKLVNKWNYNFNEQWILLFEKK